MTLHRMDDAGPLTCDELYDLYDDAGGNPTVTVRTATYRLEEAAGLTRQLAYQLDQAHSAANHGGRDETQKALNAAGVGIL